MFFMLLEVISTATITLCLLVDIQTMNMLYHRDFVVILLSNKMYVLISVLTVLFICSTNMLVFTFCCGTKATMKSQSLNHKIRQSAMKNTNGNVCV